VLNVTKLKHFYEKVKKSAEKESDAEQFNPNFNQTDRDTLKDFNDIFDKAQSEGPITRARAK
jgi:hypothetical protein